MIAKIPSYITKNRLGIYIFQYKIPSHFRQNNPTLKVLFRKSLQTRCHRDALKKSRKLIVYMDDLKEKYFKDPEAYEMAMELLKTDEYKIRQYPDFDDLEENYLLDLDELDIHLIRKARDYTEEKKQQSGKCSEDNERLDKIEEVLLRSSDKTYGKEDILLDELVSLWLTDKERRSKASSMSEYKEATNMFSRILSEEMNNEKIFVSNINSALINNYICTLYDLPPNLNKGVKKNKDIQEILKLGLKPRSQTTVHKQIKMVTEFLNWGENKNYKIFPEIVRALKTVKKPKQRDIKKRVPFDESDLNKLFNSDEYRLGKFNSASKFWVPLIALFSGGTLGELVQLYVDDIYEKDGVWVMDLNEGNDKELKVEGDDGGRPRLVPIHPQLKKLGFLDFVNDQKKSNDQKKLFPNEKRDSKNQFGSFSKKFLRYRDKVGAGPRNDKELRDFHSFRHLIRTNLEEIGVETGLIDDIIGHTSKDRSMGKQIYSHSELIKRKANAIKKLNYPCIDFTKNRGWKYHKFKI